MIPGVSEKASVSTRLCGNFRPAVRFDDFPHRFQVFDDDWILPDFASGRRVEEPFRVTGLRDASRNADEAFSVREFEKLDSFFHEEPVIEKFVEGWVEIFRHFRI